MRQQLPKARLLGAAVNQASTPLSCSNVVARIVTAAAAGKEKASALGKEKPETEDPATALAAIEPFERSYATLQKEEFVEDKGEQLFLYLGGALALGAGIWGLKGFTAAEEYFAGYLLEQSLSVDNLFVFLLCFKFFKTPLEYQDRVLGWGIWSAAVLRLVMILAGAELVQNFKPVLLVFAAILFFSSFKIIFGKKDEGEEDLSNNVLVKTINKTLPESSTLRSDAGKYFHELRQCIARFEEPAAWAICALHSIRWVVRMHRVEPVGRHQTLQVFTVTPGYRGDKFFVQEDGILKATPLFCVLAVIELSDVIFAVDSIPAIFGVTLDPVIVYTSNMAAILSLRALYGFIASVISELRYLDKAVAVVLAFIGGKMVLDQVPGGYHVTTEASLAVVVSALSIGVGASLLLPAPEEEAG